MKRLRLTLGLVTIGIVGPTLWAAGMDQGGKPPVQAPHALQQAFKAHLLPGAAVAFPNTLSQADKLQIAGLIDSYEDIVVRGDPDQNSFSVFCYGDGILRGVESVNRVGDHMAARRLLAACTTVDPDKAANLSFDLKTAL